MAGYDWINGMSNNAVKAYESGEKPLSKWTKAKIIKECEKKIKEIEINEKDNNFYKKLYPCFYKNLKANKVIDFIKKKNLKTLKEKLLLKSSWHHTSKFYNCTNFYTVDPDSIIELIENEEK